MKTIKLLICVIFLTCVLLTGKLSWTDKLIFAVAAGSPGGAIYPHGSMLSQMDINRIMIDSKKLSSTQETNRAFKVRKKIQTYSADTVLLASSYEGSTRDENIITARDFCTKSINYWIFKPLILW